MRLDGLKDFHNSMKSNGVKKSKFIVFASEKFQSHKFMNLSL